MRDDIKMKAELGFEIKTTGTNDLEAIAKIAERLKKSFDALNSAAKTAATGTPTSGKAKATGTQTDGPAQQAKIALGIDRDRLRVLKMQMSWQGKVQADSLKDAARQEKAEARAFRQRMAFGSAMAKQRIADERAVAREIEWNDRVRAQSERRSEADRRRAQRDASSRLSEAGRSGRESYRTLSRAPAAAAAVAGAGAGTVARRAVRSEMDTDSAEIDTRIYGGLSREGARDLRDKWAAPLSESLGVATANLLTSYTDALKLGIPNEGARAFTELNTKVSEAWSVPFQTVTDTLGTINTLLTSKGEAFDIGRLKSVANTLQVLAAGQSTTPEKLISFLQRGAGAAQVLGMSQEAGLAFGSASTSLGNQAGQSGRLFDYVASRLVEMPNLVKKKGDEGKHAKAMVRALGYGSARDMDQRRRADPDGFLPDFMSRFNQIADPKKKDEALRFFAGREWFGEMGRMVQGAETYKQAVQLQKDAKSKDAIEEVWKLHLEKLKTILARIRAGGLNLLNEVGKTFTPMLGQFSEYFLAWSRKLSGGAITDRIKASIEGLVQGFGFKDIPDMLNGMFGAPGEGSAGSVEAFRNTAKAFAEGVSSIFGGVKALVSAITGGDAESVARLTGRLVALSVALTALSPVIAVLGAFVGIVKTLSSLRSLATLAGSAAGGGAMAGIARGAASLAGWPAIGMTIGAAVIDYLTPRLADWLRSRLGPGFLSNTVTSGQRAITGGDNFVGSASTWIMDLFRDRPGHAVGGYVSGPGGPTSDSVMARLSNGEFVVNASAASRYGGLLQAINSGATPGFALGGSVGASLPSGTYVSPFASTRTSDDMRFLATAIGDLVRILRADYYGRFPRNRGGAGGIGGGAGSVPGVGDGPPEARPNSLMGQVVGRGRHGLLGGGAINPQLSGDVAARAKEAHDFFRAQGYSEEATAGILASLKKESNFTAGARGDGGAAHGIAQWHADRRRQILQGTGIDVSSASYSDQLRAVAWEMRHGDAGAQRAHRALMTPGITAREAGGAFVQHFERPRRDERVERGALAEGFHQQFSGGGQGPGPVAGAAGSTRALDAARGLIGAGSSQAAAALGSRMTPGQWCSDFVNGALKSANVRGTNSSVATSFLNWGQRVLDGVKPGDVVVTPRGRAAGQPGGHVGIATGETRMRNGRLQYQTVSGNHGNRVGMGWENADSVAVRRAQEANEATRAAAGAAENRQGAVSLREGAVGQRRPLGNQAPLGADVPTRGGNAGGGISGSGHTFNNTVTVNGANQSPQELASAVQRHLSDSMLRRTHDYDLYS